MKKLLCILCASIACCFFTAQADLGGLVTGALNTARNTVDAAVEGTIDTVDEGLTPHTERAYIVGNEPRRVTVRQTVTTYEN
jgi:hypothetical protein